MRYELPHPNAQIIFLESPQWCLLYLRGLGEVLRFREDLIIPDTSLSLAKGAIKPWLLGSRKMTNLRKNLLKAIAEQCGIDLKMPWQDLPETEKNFLLYGDQDQKFEIKLEYGRGKKPSCNPFWDFCRS